MTDPITPTCLQESFDFVQLWKKLYDAGHTVMMFSIVGGYRATVTRQGIEYHADGDTRLEAIQKMAMRLEA